MRPIAPRVAYLDGVPLDEVTIAEDQAEYAPITVVPLMHGNGTRTLLTRWRPTDAERKAIAEGADIYVGQLVAEWDGMTPMNVSADLAPWSVLAQQPSPGGTDG